jgi:hypothetical protein
MHGRASNIFPIEAPGKGIVRAHRIRIEDLPALFSEGPEPEPSFPARRSWLQKANRKLAQIFSGRMPHLLPAQARNEETIRAAAMRRQTQAQA